LIKVIALITDLPEVGMKINMVSKIVFGVAFIALSLVLINLADIKIAQKNISDMTLRLALFSDIPSERIKAAREIIRKGNNSDVEKELMKFLKSSNRKEEQWENSVAPCNIAIFILGSLHSKDAVPYLIERIEPSGCLPVGDLITPFSPVAQALINTGMPSVHPLIERAKEGPLLTSYWGPDRFYMMIDSILSEIMGRKSTVVYLEDAIENEDSKEKRNELEKVLRVSEDRLLGGSGRFHPIRYGITKNGYFEMHEKPVDRSPHPLKMNNSTNKDVLIYRIPEQEYRQRVENHHTIFPDSVSKETQGTSVLENYDK
jgi:hypothetical protein